MTHALKLAVIATLFLLTGCYPGISGKVVDAVSGNPLDGAVVLAQWTASHGFGFTYHTVYQIEETKTDKEGMFSISGVYNPFVDQPELVIYKKGYVPYRNDMIFKDRKRYKKVEWENNKIYKLEHWKKEYSINILDSYLRSGLIGVSGKTPKYQGVLDENYDNAVRELNSSE